MRLLRHLNEMKVWLDDERKAPSGWKHFKGVKELISFYKKNYDNIDSMSLDHDLGENVPTGYDFVIWLEEMVFTGKYNTIPKMKVHSANPVGKKRMQQAIRSMEKKLS